MSRVGKARADRALRRNTILTGVALVVICGLAYVVFTANSGLPLQPFYRVSVDVPNAAHLIPTSDVRVGGVRVGQVSSIDAVSPKGSRRSFARLELALDRDVGPLPANSAVAIRQAAVLGATYVDLTLGDAAATVPDHGRLRTTGGRPPAELTDLYAVFDRETRVRFKQSLEGIGGGLAGQGVALGGVISAFSRLLPDAGRVARTLAQPATRLGPFLHVFDVVSASFDDQRKPFGALLGDAAETFGAMTRPAGALGQAIDELPGAESDLTRAFVSARPATRSIERLALALQPAGDALRPALRELNPALTDAQSALTALRPLERPARRALDILRAFARSKAVDGGLRKLLELVPPVNQILGTVAPAQLHCNVIGLYGTEIGAVVGGPKMGPNGPVAGQIAFTTLGASQEMLQNSRPSPNLGINPLPREDASECESNNEPWSGAQQLNNPPGQQSGRTRRSTPPPGVLDRARAAGLLDLPEGAR